jgi:hypothetical protein
MTVTYDYYADAYFGEPVSETDFVKYAARAERIINTIIRGRLHQFDDWHVNVQEAVRNAICAQVEYFALYGLDVAVAGRQGGGFTVGKVSVQDGGDGSNGAKGAASIVAPAVYSYLEQTGLLYPGVPVVGMPPR